jgi:Protein of unknown function (DUF1676)
MIKFKFVKANEKKYRLLGVVYGETFAWYRQMALKPAQVSAFVQRLTVYIHTSAYNDRESMRFKFKFMLMVKFSKSFSPHPTARILTKQFVLPFLLGLKFKLASLLPIVFWLLILLCKKGMFLLKAGVFLSGLLGFNSLFSLGAFAPHLGLHGGIGGGGGLLHQPIGGGIGGIGGIGLGGYGQQQYGGVSSGYYKSPRDKLVPSETAENIVVAPQNDNFYDYEKKVYHQTDRTGKMQLDQLDDDQFVVRHRSEDNHHNAYRNFAWQTRV